MKALTLEDTDMIIEELHNIVNSNNDLQSRLKSAPDWRERWKTLERFVLQNLEKVGIDYSLYSVLWVRERFFYKMQRDTGMDYGFCEYFTPAFRNRTQSILDDDLKLDLDNKCSYGLDEPVMAICCGTERDFCVVLHPEIKEQREKVMENYADSLVGSLNAQKN